MYNLRFVFFYPFNIFFRKHSVSFIQYLVPCTLYLGFISCGNEVKPKQEINPVEFKQALEKVNKYEVEKQSDEINRYIQHRKWKMEMTGTGLRYMFLKKGDGIQVKSGDFVKVDYKISLLDGTVCYSSAEDGTYEFKVEGDAIESGLHEAIQLMHVGDKAKFILPPHLAHGLHGDDAKIPPLSAIIVDLELLEIN